MTLNTLSMIQNTLFMTHNTLFVNEITQTLFYAEIADFAICVWRTWSCVSSRLENVKRLVFCFYPLYSLPKPYPCGISTPLTTPPLVASDQSIGLFLHLGNSCTAAATTAGLEPAAFYWKILITRNNPILNISSICKCKNLDFKWSKYIQHTES